MLISEQKGTRMRISGDIIDMAGKAIRFLNNILTAAKHDDSYTI